MAVIFPYIGNHHSNWLIFFRGVETTNQYDFSRFLCVTFLWPLVGMQHVKKTKTWFYLAIAKLQVSVTSTTRFAKDMWRLSASSLASNMGSPIGGCSWCPWVSWLKSISNNHWRVGFVQVVVPRSWLKTVQESLGVRYMHKANSWRWKLVEKLHQPTDRLNSPAIWTMEVFTSCCSPPMWYGHRIGWELVPEHLVFEGTEAGKL